MLSTLVKEASKIVHNSIYLLAPNHCLACNGMVDKKEGIICTFCRNAFQKLNIHLEQDNFVAQKFWGKAKLKHAFAYLQYHKGGVSQKLIHNLKYKGFQEIGLAMGLWYGKDLEENDFAKEFDLILPVPLHKSRLLSRGYNQSDSFAQGLAETMGIEWSNKAIIRRLASISQTKKGRMDRWKNVEKIFEVSDSKLIKDKRILLVDDVITTGSTLEACLNELIPHAKEVSIATIAAGS